MVHQHGLTEAGNKDNFSDGGAHTGGAWHSLRMALMPAGVHNRCLGLLVALLAIAFVILTIPAYLRRRRPELLPIPADY